MPLTNTERRRLITELRALDPYKHASIIDYHRQMITKEENKK